jgi:hypothetical protein
MIEKIFIFLDSGYLILISFFLLIVYFKFRNKISFIKFKFLSDISVIALFIFSIDVIIAPHRYYYLIKDYVVKVDILKTANYSQDLEFVINSYTNIKLEDSTKLNLKDAILEEFKYIKDVKK